MKSTFLNIISNKDKTKKDDDLYKINEFQRNWIHFLEQELKEMQEKVLNNNKNTLESEYLFN